MARQIGSSCARPLSLFISFPLFPPPGFRPRSRGPRGCLLPFRCSSGAPVPEARAPPPVRRCVPPRSSSIPGVAPSGLCPSCAPGDRFRAHRLAASFPPGRSHSTLAPSLPCLPPSRLLSRERFPRGVSASRTSPAWPLPGLAFTRGHLSRGKVAPGLLALACLPLVTPPRKLRHPQVTPITRFVSPGVAESVVASRLARPANRDARSRSPIGRRLFPSGHPWAPQPGGPPRTTSRSANRGVLLPRPRPLGTTRAIPGVGRDTVGAASARGHPGRGRAEGAGALVATLAQPDQGSTCPRRSAHGAWSPGRVPAPARAAGTGGCSRPCGPSCFPRSSRIPAAPHPLLPSGSCDGGPARPSPGSRGGSSAAAPTPCSSETGGWCWHRVPPVASP